jgi:hypothetical protein
MSPTKPYEMPPLGSLEHETLNWCLNAVQEGDAWLQAQRPIGDWEKVLSMLGPSDDSTITPGLSKTGYNLVERNARDIVASLSNFRHDGEFKPQFDKSKYAQAHELTKLDGHWYRETDAYGRHRENLQHAVAFGTGYLMQDYDKDFWGDHGDISLRAVAPQNVTFVQLPNDSDIQKAYAVIVREEMPINLARSQYFAFADRFVPDRDTPSWLAKGLRKVQKFFGGSPALATAGTSGRKNTGSFPSVDIFKMYVRDNSINEGPGPRKMGVRGTNWSYTVPALGDELPTGVINPATGQSWTRPAEYEDCKLFPLRRYVIFSRTAVIYDGSSPWWHGDVPITRTRFNDWAWEALGKSLLGDVKTMQDGIIAIMRLIEDACAARLDPAMLYNENSVSEGFAKAFSPRLAGVRAAVNLDAGDVVKFPVPVEHYDVPLFIPQHMKDQENRINHQMATPDLVAVAKAKQIPSSDSLEKLMEMAGPLVQDMIRQLEMPLRQLGNWRKAYYFQFYTYSRMIQITGPDELLEDYEYTPDKLVPFLSNDEPLQAKQDRTKRYLREFKYHLTESGINEIHRMVNRLALLQLRKAGLPIDWWTIGKAWKLSNLGPEPEGTNNMLERFIAEKHMERELAEEMAGAVGGGQGPGRPNSNKKQPQIVSKDGGTRSTIKTS